MPCAAVVGYPIDHSLSPVLHRAAYQALGCEEWTYDRIPCPPGHLARIVSNCSPDYRGFSVTMPAKKEALLYADQSSDRAQKVGAANTLVRHKDGWWADCTDIDGATHALQQAQIDGGSVLILGAGSTVRPYIDALHTLTEDTGNPLSLTIASRSRERAQDTLNCADRYAVPVTWCDLSSSDEFQKAADSATQVISTLPADAGAAYAPALHAVERYVDVTYAPWPTSLAEHIAPHATTVVGGLTMLIHQAVRQVELFTGKEATPAMIEAMYTSVL